MVALPPTINVDPLQPSSKKSKRHLVDYTNSLHGMENMTDMDTTEEPNRGGWGSHTFADMCREEVPVPQLYLGKDDDRVFDDFEELCEMDQSDETPGLLKARWYQFHLKGTTTCFNLGVVPWFSNC